MNALTSEIRSYFRDGLRDARATALADAEAFDDVVQVIERLGGYLQSRHSGNDASGRDTLLPGPSVE